MDHPISDCPVGQKPNQLLGLQCRLTINLRQQRQTNAFQGSLKKHDKVAGRYPGFNLYG